MTFEHMRSVSMVNFLEELAKCQLLCRPCHGYKTVVDCGHSARAHGKRATGDCLFRLRTVATGQPTTLAAPALEVVPDPQPIGAKPAAYWKEQGDLAKSTRLTYERWWEANLKAYSPQPGMDPDHYGNCINTNRDFTLVERKKSDLFYQRPEVSLQPSPLL